MDSDKDKKLTLGDQFAIAFLLHQIPNLQYEIIIANKRAFVEVPLTEEIYKVLSLFNRGTSVNAYEFSNLVRRVKSELIAARKQAERQQNKGGITNG